MKHPCGKEFDHHNAATFRDGIWSFISIEELNYMPDHGCPLGVMFDSKGEWSNTSVYPFCGHFDSVDHIDHPKDLINIKEDK